MRFHYHPTVIAIGAKRSALFGARHYMGRHFQSFWLIGNVFGQGFEFPGIMRGVKPTRHQKIALDRFGGDERFDPGKRIVSLFDDIEGRLGAVLTRQCVLVRFDAGADLATIARTAAPASVLGVQD